MSVSNYYFENKAYDSKGIDINEQIIQKNCGNSLGKIYVESRNLVCYCYKSSAFGMHKDWNLNNSTKPTM